MLMGEKEWAYHGWNVILMGVNSIAPGQQDSQPPRERCCQVKLRRRRQEAQGQEQRMPAPPPLHPLRI